MSRTTEAEMENRAGALPLFQRIENAAAYVIVTALVLVPFFVIVMRVVFGMSIPGEADLVAHLTILAAFSGCLLTTRKKKHLAISAAIDRIENPLKTILQTISSFFSVLVVTTLFWTALSFLEIYIGGYDSNQYRIAFVPKLYFVLVMPAALLVMVCRFIQQTPKGAAPSIIVLAGALFGTFLSFPSLLFFLGELVSKNNPEFYLKVDSLLCRLQGIQVDLLAVIKMPMILLLVCSAFFGTPIFVVLGGLAFFLYAANAEPLTSVIDEAYKALTSTGIPAIPLFTLTGFLLSASRAGERFLNLMKALLGWLPGGIGVAGVLILAFFTTFTGASGVTILALGGLLSYILVRNNYHEKFTLGLITASGSIGLLFPPSLPLILFGIVAQFILKDWVRTHPSAAGMMQAMEIKNLFLAGILPGVLLVMVLSLLVLVHAVRRGVPRFAFDIRGVGIHFGKAAWEMMLPFLLVALFLTGLITITDVSAIAVLYVFIVEVIVHRDVSFRDLFGIAHNSLVIVGGILIILAVSKGLAQYIIVEQIPDRIVDWMQLHVHSKYLFLMLLNIGLLLTGCFLDIYSAIAVVAPIVIPVGLSYGVNPVHLGIVFLANLELGYLTPPVGLNLFMSSYRFEKPVSEIYSSIVMFILALLAAVLFITYVPCISTAFI